MKKLMMAVGAAILAAGAFAQGESFAYQGVLCDDKGNPIDTKSQKISFRLYDAITEGKKLWSHQISIRTDANGLFNVELGDSAGNNEMDATNTLAWAFGETTKKGRDLFIALEVDGSSGEIRPRQKLLSTPLSSYAQDVSRAASTFTVAGKATFNGGAEFTKNGVVEFNGGVTFAKGQTAAFNGGVSFAQGQTATFNGGTTFGGGTTFNGGTTFGSGATFSNGISVSGNSKFANDVSVNGGAVISNGLTVAGGYYNVMPVGTIVMWYGDKANVPKGWHICDGSNGTPNLQGRFPVGANADHGDTSAYAVGNTGGVERVTLTVDQMPKHTHDIKYPRRNVSQYGDETRDVVSRAEQPPSEYKINEQISVLSAGGDQPHENRPPFFALYFIMRTAN